MSLSHVVKVLSPSASQPQHPLTETHKFGDWILTASASHILSSSCTCSSISARGDFDSKENNQEILPAEAKRGESLSEEQGGGERAQNIDTSACTINTTNAHCCQHCYFERDLPLKELPEMVFPNNTLKLEHNPTGCTMMFNAFDALCMVDHEHAPPYQVAPAAQWQQGVRESKMSTAVYSETDLKKYDWTFRTAYAGTLTPAPGDKTNKVWEIEEYVADESRIPLDKLKRQDKIFFYKELTLYEDELSDNGCSMLSIRVRVMRDFVFILLRHFFRLDHVHVRIQDTRVYLEKDSDSVIREVSVRDCPISQLKPNSPLTQPDALWTMLPLVSSRHEVLTPSTEGDKS